MRVTKGLAVIPVCGALLGFALLGETRPRPWCVTTIEASRVRGGACYKTKACAPQTSCHEFCSQDILAECTKNTTRAYETEQVPEGGGGYKFTRSFCADELCAYPTLTLVSCESE
jgi:hypothetical protein